MLFRFNLKSWYFNTQKPIHDPLLYVNSSLINKLTMNKKVSIIHCRFSISDFVCVFDIICVVQYMAYWLKSNKTGILQLHMIPKSGYFSSMLWKYIKYTMKKYQRHHPTTIGVFNDLDSRWGSCANGNVWEILRETHWFYWINDLD